MMGSVQICFFLGCPGLTQHFLPLKEEVPCHGGETACENPACRGPTSGRCPSCGCWAGVRHQLRCLRSRLLERAGGREEIGGSEPCRGQAWEVYGWRTVEMSKSLRGLETSTEKSLELQPRTDLLCPQLSLVDDTLTR